MVDYTPCPTFCCSPRFFCAAQLEGSFWVSFILLKYRRPSCSTVGCWVDATKILVTSKKSRVLGFDILGHRDGLGLDFRDFGLEKIPEILRPRVWRAVEHSGRVKMPSTSRSNNMNTSLQSCISSSVRLITSFICNIFTKESQFAILPYLLGQGDLQSQAFHFSLLLF